MVLISLHNISADPDIFFAFSKSRFTSVWSILLPVKGISAVIKCVAWMQYCKYWSTAGSFKNKVVFINDNLVV